MQTRSAAKFFYTLSHESRMDNHDGLVMGIRVYVSSRPSLLVSRGRSFGEGGTAKAVGDRLERCAAEPLSSGSRVF